MTTMFDRLLAQEQRRARRRNWLARLGQSCVVMGCVALLRGWSLMLAVGIAHHIWLPHLPTLGYSWAVLLVLLMGWVGGPPYGRPQRKADPAP